MARQKGIAGTRILHLRTAGEGGTVRITVGAQYLSFQAGAANGFKKTSLMAAACICTLHAQLLVKTVYTFWPQEEALHPREVHSSFRSTVVGTHCI